LRRRKMEEVLGGEGGLITRRGGTPAPDRKAGKYWGRFISGEKGKRRRGRGEGRRREEGRGEGGRGEGGRGEGARG